MIEAYLASVGLRGPGLASWTSSRAVLGGRAPYRPGVLPRPAGTPLPAMERRRATTVTRLAVEVAAETLGPRDPSGIATVFASSGGEVEVIQAIFEELARPQPVLSPIQFHNSVHNAAAGYWSIATGARSPSSSVGAYDDSFGSGLMEALTQCRTEGCPVLLVAYDCPPGFPLGEHRPLIAPFAVGLLLTPECGADTLARLRAEFVAAAPGASAMLDPDLERLRRGNPAARSLPLLAALAQGEPAEVRLGCGMGGGLLLEVQPWR
ncbi:beta-ketoacyl synthase chain length factor [Candidatus Methylocalor cossyra]|uniref:3-oxoacyl-(Acyl-carrier-protein) synthase n=1 Tax=Candidatus Methylocalor cossyra TaxID=3108543 RepID=A0ABM9NHB7_9GAMM